MRNPRATSWRTWCHAGGLAGIVAAASALAPASELENVGYASRPSMSDIQAEIDATLPIVEDDLSATDDSIPASDSVDRPMYRLPAIEEMSAPAPVELPQLEASPAELPPVALPPVDVPPITAPPIAAPKITPLPKPTDEQTEERTEEPAEPEPTATLPTITILPPVDTPPDMTLVEEAPADEGVETNEVAEEIEEEPESAPPTITILPPVDSVPELQTESETQVEPEFQEVAETAEPSAPTITILPPVEAPPPAEAASTTDESEIAEENISAEFDATWNEGDSPAAAPETKIAPLPVMLPPVPPIAETPTTPIAEPLPPITELETVPQAQNAPPQVTPYSPTTAELSRQLLPRVQKAYRLAQQGAVFAAQAEFIQVLRRIAEAKDSADGTDAHSRALAAGLRAIDEADDFAPSGTELEADVNVTQIASAHRTQVLKNEESPSTPIRPAVAVARYHEFARAELANAVAGEQAGSMALHGLGKVHLRLARGNDNQLQHERTALAMFAAALDAGPGNHLAANEIGVLLSRAGYPAEASAMFRHAIDLAPTSTTYHNLAMTDRAMGYHEQAAANERYAFELARRDRAANAASRSHGIAWVAPQELSRMAQPMPIEMQSQQQIASSPPAHMVQPIGGPARGNVETASKWPKKLIPGSFWR